MTRRRPPAAAVRFAAEPLERRAYLAPLVLAPHVDYPAGGGPAALAAADLNGDGRPDLIVGDYASDSVDVLINNGNGTFAPPVPYPVGTGVQAIAVADLNGDGRPDIVAVGNAADQVAVLINHGDGTFAAPVDYPVGVRPEAVVVADLNGDGHPDVITADEGSGSVSVLNGIGDGTFQGAVDYPAGANPVDVVAADLNGDGHIDLVTLGPDNDLIHVLTNLGDGTFGNTPVAESVDETARSIAVADLNNDARPDLIVTELTQADVGVLTNTGDATAVTAATPIGAATFSAVDDRRTGAFPFAVAVGDLTGDHRPDLVTADSRDDTVGVLVHTANGADFNMYRLFPVGTAPEAVAIADLNGDGRPDVISANFDSDSVSVLMNETAFPSLTTTTATVTASRTTVQQGNPVTLTATVTPAPTGGGGRAVQFLAGDKVLGVATLSAAGTATVTTTLLPAGVAEVTAQFNGNAVYAPTAAERDVTVLAAAAATPLLAPTAVVITSTAGRVAGKATPTETAAAAVPAVAPPTVDVTPDAAGPVVAATAVAVSTPGPYTPGETAAVSVTITNQGGQQAVGTVALALSIAPADDLAAAVPLPIDGQAGFDVSVAPTKGTPVPVGFVVPATLAAGSYTILAAVRADSFFAGGQIDTAPTSLATPVTVVLVRVPFLPGDTGTAAVTVADQGPGRAAGSVAVSLAIEPVDGSTIGGSTAAVPVAVVGPSTFAVDLRGGTSRAVPVRFTIPATIEAGTYAIVATLTAAGGVTAAQVSTTPVATATPAPVVTGFGQIGVHHDYVLTTTLGDGGVVTVALAGPGTGSLTDDGNGAINLSLVGTGPTSVLSVVPRSGTVEIDGLTDYYNMGAVDAAGVAVVAPASAAAALPALAIDVTSSLRRLTVASVTNAVIGIGPHAATAVSLGVVTNSNLSTNARLADVAVTSWDGGLLSADAITGTLSSAGAFTATVTVADQVGTVHVGSLADAVLAARTFGDVTIGGDLSGSYVVAGLTALGIDGSLGGGNDTFTVGTIAAVQVGGDVTGSTVAAGIRPASDAPFTTAGATLLRGGRIGRIVVGGTVDAASAFLAASVPAVERG